MLYLIVYDLRNKKREHGMQLHDIIATNGEDFYEITDSSFVVISRLSLEEWYHLIKQKLESDDYFFITQIQSSQFAGFLSDKAADWFSKQVC